jgi:GH25 family lysozyme M1 (1,4-beta-N-acetylmuramidase)
MKQKKKLLRRLLVLAGLLGCMALLLIASSDSRLGRFRFYLPETVEFGGQQIEVDTSLERNQLAEEAFQAEEDGTITYQGEALQGIDLSSHQGEVDWAAVAESGIDFAMVRIGYRGYGSAGRLAQDERFLENLTGAQAQGIQVGGYFFSQATTPEEAEEEAAFALSLLDGAALDFPIAYDWEPIINDTARTDGMTTEEVTACAVAFCQVIRQAGYDTVLYCNGELGYLTYDLSQLRECQLWYAEYGSVPSFTYAFSFWQYSNTGQVPGISGNVDLDLYFPETVDSEQVSAPESVGEEP